MILNYLGPITAEQVYIAKFKQTGIQIQDRSVFIVKYYFADKTSINLI